MARATRIALDLALISMAKIRPTVSKIWGAAKSFVSKTPAKPLVSNIVVDKVEIALDKLTGVLQSGVISLRNKQLPREEKYLENELHKVRQRITTTSKAVRPVLGTAWQYAKTEMVPPMTLEYFHGPAGKALENSAAKIADGLIASLNKSIKEIDKAALKAQQLKEAAITAAAEKAKAAAKAKQLENKRIEEEKRKSDEKAAKAKAEAKAKSEAKPKSEAKAKEAKKASTQKVEKAKEIPKVEKNKPAKKDEPNKKTTTKK